MAITRRVLRAPGRAIDATVVLPGSKSLTNRALVAAALGDGDSALEGILLADDTRLMIEALRSLGTRIEVSEVDCLATVHGTGGFWPHGEADLDCGNAGTVMRFLTGACAAGFGDYRLDGSARMRERPIGALVDALRDLGAAIGYGEREGYPPITIRARGLRGGSARMVDPPSSQFVSAVLMAAPLATSDVMLEVTGTLPSEPYVAMTLAVMDAFGVGVVTNDAGRFIVPGGQRYQSTQYAIEPDASSASYFFAAAAVTGGRVTVERLGSASCQGDVRFVDVLASMGCRVEQDAHSTTVIGPSDGALRGVDVDLRAMPDVAPTLAVAAAFAEGPTRIRGVGNLRIKETDRLHALATELGRMEVATEIHEEGLTIMPGRLPVAAEIATYDDHRMAMSFAVAGLRVDGVTILDSDCVGKTFPGFWDAWGEI